MFCFQLLIFSNYHGLIGTQPHHKPRENLTSLEMFTDDAGAGEPTHLLVQPCLPAPSLPPEPSSSLPLLHRRAVGTSGFLRGCFPHFWKPTAVWFAVVKALARAQPSGTAGGWEGPEWGRHSLSAHCVPGPRESQMLKTVPALQESHYLIMDTNSKGEKLKTDVVSENFLAIHVKCMEKLKQ